jgi:TusA-related sulfurtransferase
MARSSKPRARYAPARPEHQLTLTAGGGAELIDLETGETVWVSNDDDDFLEEFPDFLKREDLADILDYLEEVGELTHREADRCDIQEETIDAADLAGMVRNT